MTTTVELRHTGLLVPHDRIALAGPGLVALDGRIVGHIEIDREDHCEVFVPAGPGLTADEFFDYAAACRDPVGNAIDVEDIFVWLRAEYCTQRALERAADAGETIAQAMEPHGDGYMPGLTIPVEPDETRQDVLERVGQLDMPVGTWWRIYDGSKWVELDPHSST